MTSTIQFDPIIALIVFTVCVFVIKFAVKKGLAKAASYSINR